jgi:hypothetical protein
MEMILCILLLMKGCMFCKYTPATVKKELGTRIFLSQISWITLFPEIHIKSVNP